MKRRGIFSLMAAVAIVAATPLLASAQTFPEKPITLIIPYPPGGSADLIGRMVADKLSTSLGQPVVVENKGGAAGVIGTETVARAEADGYTLSIGISDTHAIAPAVNPALPYDPQKDFVPVSLLAVQPLTLAVGRNAGISSISEFIEKAKAEPGEVTYASNGVGGMQHLAMELLASNAGVKMLHVPYAGSGPAIADVIGGHVDSLFISLQGAGGNFESGNMIPVAVSADKRLDALPNVPTFTESGYPDFQASQWYGLFAPAGTPAEIVARLNEDAKAAMADPSVAKPLMDVGTSPVGSSSEEFVDFLAGEIDQWAKVAKQNNVVTE